MTIMTDAGLAETAFHFLETLQPTRLIASPELARRTGVGRVLLKIEADRPLGNFKQLGGMFAGLLALARRPAGAPAHLICASDGNHGLAVTAAAQSAGAKASVFLPDTVTAVRAERIRGLGGEVVWVAGTYDDAVEAAAAFAARGEGVLIADTAPDPADPVVHDVMAGYAALARELYDQLREAGASPTHLYVQAGVGGLAAALVDSLAETMSGPRRTLAVEPRAAACVAAALRAGRPVQIDGDLHTSAEMLSCGLASAPALEVLRRRGVGSVLVDEDRLAAAVRALGDATGVASTASGAAGLAGLLEVAEQPALRVEHGLTEDSVVLLVVTEGAAE